MDKTFKVFYLWSGMRQSACCQHLCRLSGLCSKASKRNKYYKDWKVREKTIVKIWMVVYIKSP